MTQQASERMKAPVVLTLASIVIVIAGLKIAAPIVAQFLMSLFIAVICTPAVRWLEEKRKVPRGLAIVLVLALVVIVVSLLVALIGDSLNSFSENKDIYAQRLQERLAGLTSWMASVGLPTATVNFSELFETADVMTLVSRVVGGLGVIFGDFFVIFLSVIFLLMETASFQKKLETAFADSKEKMANISMILNNIRHYLAIKTYASLLTGALVTVGMMAIGVDYPFLWGMLAFLLNYIPNIGSIIAAIPAVMLALVQLGPAAMMWTIFVFLGANSFVGNFLEPRYMGKVLGLSTFVVFASLIFWGWIFGSVGMFLSVPLTMTIKIALDTNEDTRWLGILLGSSSDLEQEVDDEGEKVDSAQA